MKRTEMLGKRLFMSAGGVAVCGFSVGLFRRAVFGVDPFQSFVTGLDALVPLDFGTVYVIVNAALLVFALLADWHRIGVATLINLFLLGYIVQFTTDFLFLAFPQLSLPARALMLLAGIVVLCFSSSFYFTANLGVSTYDAVALIISGTWQKGKFKYVRIATDFFCVLAGAVLFLLGGNDVAQLKSIIGFATIITAFFMGPLIDFFNVHVAKPFLNWKIQKN